MAIFHVNMIFVWDKIISTLLSILNICMFEVSNMCAFTNFSCYLS